MGLFGSMALNLEAESLQCGDQVLSHLLNPGLLLRDALLQKESGTSQEMTEFCHTYSAFNCCMYMQSKSKVIWHGFNM